MADNRDVQENRSASKAGRIDRLYIAITRWITFSGATVAFLVLVGALIYAMYLFRVSTDRDIDAVQYTQKRPQVNYEEVMADDEARRKAFLALKTYVYSVIKNGSEGHGYPIEKMKGNIVTGKDAEILSVFVAKKLEGHYPEAFSKCTSCHGVDGEGNSGMAPNLKVLPIYNHLRTKVANPKKALSNMKKKQVQKPSRSKWDKHIDILTSNINHYAIEVEQDGVSREDMDTMMRRITRQLDYPDAYIDQLITATDKLLIYGKQYAKANYSYDAISWREFLRSFTEKYAAFEQREREKAREIAAENDRRRAEKIAQSNAAQLRLLTVLSVVGVTIIAFLLLTLILVMMKIERNTRRSLGDVMRKEDENEPSV